MRVSIFPVKEEPRDLPRVGGVTDSRRVVVPRHVSGQRDNEQRSAGDQWDKAENHGGTSLPWVTPSLLPRPCELGDVSEDPLLWCPVQCLMPPLPSTDGAFLDLREISPLEGLAGLRQSLPAPGEEAAQVREPALPEALLRAKEQSFPVCQLGRAGCRGPAAGPLPEEPPDQPALRPGRLLDPCSRLDLILPCRILPGREAAYGPGHPEQQHLREEHCPSRFLGQASLEPSRYLSPHELPPSGTAVIRLPQATNFELMTALNVLPPTPTPAQALIVCRRGWRWPGGPEQRFSSPLATGLPVFRL